MCIRDRDIQYPTDIRLLHEARQKLSLIHIFVFVIYWMLKKTAFGFEIQAMGKNLAAAETSGINIKKQFLLTMFISGALAGLGGGVEVLGVHKYFISGFSSGYGYDGLSISVLGQNNPFGVLISAILYGALRSGAQLMDRTTSVSYTHLDVYKRQV